MILGQSEFLEWANAGGTVTLPIVLIYGLRYLAAQFKTVQEQNAAAHAQTVELLTGVVKEATLTMRDVRHTLDRVNESMGACHELNDHRRIALAQSRVGKEYLSAGKPGEPPKP